MKLPVGFLAALGVVPIAQLTCAKATGGGGGGGGGDDVRPSAARDTFSRFAGVAEAGVAEVHPIAPEDEQAGDALVKALEEDDQNTVVGQVELGELLCDSLEDAPGSSMLRFAITSNETVIAERTFYSSVDGGVLADGKERKVWMGNVVDPEPLFPRTVSMTWTDPCDVETFLLKIVSANLDGSTSIIKSIPCAAGSSTELCMVELAVVFSPEEEGVPSPGFVLADEEVKEQGGVRRLAIQEHSPTPTTTKESVYARGLRGSPGGAATNPRGRGLAAGTTVDVLVLYSEEAWTGYADYPDEASLLSAISAAFVTSNQALVNSDIDMEFNVVQVAQLPYAQSSTSSSTELTALKANSDVLALRNQFRADLVAMMGYFPGTCGLASTPGDHSVTAANCFDNLSHTHEMAHNFGCYHNKENSGTQHAYRHGFRYCSGSDPYRTIMSYFDKCSVPRVNYFSNPDVSFQGKPTGTVDANNAQCIRDRMSLISLLREPCVDDGTTCASRNDCCSDFCLEGVCAIDTCGEAGGSRHDIGNALCDPANNIEECNWDGGDCCECDCEDPIEGTWDCVVSPNQVGQGFFIFGNAAGHCSPVAGSDVETCGYFDGNTCDCTCNTETIETCGTGGGFDCNDPASTCGTTSCTSDAQCTLPEQCCPVKQICEEPVSTNPLACGDPHMTGFRGQKFDFTGEDGEWYCLISDRPSVHMNMRVTTPLPSTPEITYITGLSIVTTDDKGVDHSIVIEVTNPHSIDSACPSGVTPCLADGALSVLIDGSETLLQPGTIEIAQDLKISAANLPGECRSFGFEEYWEKKTLAYARATSRKLSAEQGMGEWIIGDPTATNPEECMEYVAKAMSRGEAGLFEHQSEHTSFRIATPTATIRLSHGRLHQLPMRDPTDSFYLPEHLTWQMNIAVDHNDVSVDATGILGETLVPTVDEDGNRIMSGMASIRGSQADYRVEGPLEVHFTQDGSD